MKAHKRTIRHFLLFLWTFDALHVCARRGFFSGPDTGRIESSAIADPFSPPSYQKIALNLLPEEFRSEFISLTETLESLESANGPYCPSRLATLLQRCAKDRLIAEDREEAAVLLTLCDRSHDYFPPMECEGFSSGEAGSTRAAVKRCAIALDQHQNFQRTFDIYRILVIPEKCNSLNGIFNVDPLRSVYNNITLDLSKFLQAVTRKEMKQDEHFAIWNDYVMAFRKSAADLDLVKSSLVNSNAQFISDMGGMIRTLDLAFEEMRMKILESNNRVSAELILRLNKVGEEHERSLALTASSVEAMVSAGINEIFSLARERQSALDVATSLVINQLIESAGDLSATSQEFKALSIFIKETTSKAYNQAFLLDKIQQETSKSMASLSSEIEDLSSATRKLNVSLTNIRLENINQLSWPRLNGAWILASLFRRFDLSICWAFGLLLLLMSRVLRDRILAVLLWLTVSLFSQLTLSFFTRRGMMPNKFDVEWNRYSPRPRVNPSPSTHEDYALYAESGKEMATINPEASLILHPGLRISEMRAIYKGNGCSGEGAPVPQNFDGMSYSLSRSRARIMSRIPSRLYKSEDQSG